MKAMISKGLDESPRPEGHIYKIGDLISKRYRIQEILGGEGKSSMGIVYVCHDIQHDLVLALKTLQKRFLLSKRIVDSFKKEALAWIHLEKHPNIVRAYWVRELDDLMFVACEFIEPDWAARNTLTSYLKSPFSLGRALSWAIQFCYGMEYAASRGITPHRDVKPDNIMITAEGAVKIADFGLVGLWDKTDKPEEIDVLLQRGKQGLTFLTTYNNRIVAGSPPWMAPEQFYGVSEMRSDIYSFGIVLFQLFSGGELPFRPAGGDNWAKAHKMYRVPSAPQAGRPISGILHRCLEKRRDRRFDDFAELRGDLEEVFRKEITKKTGQEPPSPPVVGELKEGELINKGMSLANLGLVEEGIKQYKEGLKINPRNPAAHYNLGNALAQKGRLREAAAEYRKAIAIAPNLTAAHFNLAMALLRSGEIDAAISEYREAIRTKPSFAEAYVNLGVAYHKKGEVDQALKAYRQAVRINPRHAEAHHKIGMTFFMKGLLDEAINAYRDALRINPQYAEVHNNLGAALFKKGLTDEAIGSYGKAIMSRPGFADAYYNIGIAFAKGDLHTEAIRAFKEFIKSATPKDQRIEKAMEFVASLMKKTDSR
jgi:serine/threonine protein kinase